MVAVANSCISDKTGREDRSVEGFTLSTFCANAISERQSHLVSGTRRFVKSFGRDGPAPSLSDAPHWYLWAKMRRAEDFGAELLRKSEKVDRLDLLDASNKGCIQMSTDTMAAAAKLMDMDDSLSKEEAISLSLASFPMPSHKPRYLSLEEALETRERQDLFDLTVRDEQFIDAYDESEY